jgi:hypothetical protein
MAMVGSRKGLKTITAHFQRSARDISSGRLITVQDFRLFDSIGAIEIMDPKMDSGFVPADEQSGAVDLTTVFLLPEAVWILEEITSLQLAWFEGQTLSQTLLTSYHIDNLLSCEKNELSRILFRPPQSNHDEKEAANASYNATVGQHILRHFCIASIKAVALAMAEIDGSFAPIYDEEDISMTTYGLSLFSKATVGEIVHQMSKALNMFSLIGSKIPGMRAEDVKWLSDRFQMLVRLQIALLDGVDIENNVPRRVHAWSQALAILPSLGPSPKRSLLRPVPSAFGHRLQGKYAATQPMKPPVRTDFETTRTHWMLHVNLILAALDAAPSYAVPEMVSMTKVWPPQKGRADVQENLESFTYSRGEHFVYAQALAQSRFWNAEGGSIERFIAYDMRQSVWVIDGIFDSPLGTSDLSLSTPLTLSPAGHVIHAALTKFYRVATELRGVCL